MSPRRPSPPPTKRPPPDPVDAAREALDRAVAAGKAFRDADDFDDPTGQHAAQPAPVFQVHNHYREDSVHDRDDSDGDSRHSALPKIPKNSKGIIGAVFTGVGALIAGLAAVAHALGWL